MTVLPMGNTVDTVRVDIHYGLIEHFSKHLYTSPAKAIEELVTNGFDAFASWVRVYLPSGRTPERILIWDNGDSMDIEGLKSLWWIANSPKKREGYSPANQGGLRERKMIGKFGIGKLASYTLAGRIAHLCRQGVDQFYLVEMDYAALLSDPPPPSTTAPVQRKEHQTPIVKLSQTEARSYVESLFSSTPSDFEVLFAETHWTIVILSDLKTTAPTRGWLRWVLGNGMPLRPDFQVLVEEEAVLSRLERSGIDTLWDFGATEIKEALQKEWQDRKLPGTLSFDRQLGLNPQKPTETVAFVDLPELGKVWGHIRLYRESLRAESTGGDERESRSHGFFLIVKGRLINADDPEFFLPPPSFGTFFRSQYVLEVDGLDEDLLADRERIAKHTARADELRALQHAVYLVTAAQMRRRDQEAADAARTSHQLPTSSLPYFIAPVSALISHKATPEQAALFNLSDPQIERKARNETEPMASLSEDGKGFNINVKHPYYTAISKTAGSGVKGTAVMQQYEKLAIAEQVFEGFLLDLGLEEGRIAAIMDWRDKLYRQLAEVSRTPADQLALELHEASFAAGATFEIKIVEVLERMGFQAVRDAASGMKDGLVMALASDRSYRFTFEAKGKKTEGGINNDDAEVGGANAHRLEAKAGHAVIIAREFKGFARLEKPAVYQECAAIEGGTRVSLMTVEAMGRMLQAMERHHFPLDDVQHIFTRLETPEEKLRAIEQLEQPLQDFNYTTLIEQIYQEQKGLGKGRSVSALSIFQRHYLQEEWEGDEYDREYQTFRNKLTAVATAAFPLMVYQSESEQVALRQSPEHVRAWIQRALERDES